MQCLYFSYQRQLAFLYMLMFVCIHPANLRRPHKQGLEQSVQSLSETLGLTKSIRAKSVALHIVQTNPSQKVSFRIHPGTRQLKEGSGFIWMDSGQH